ncbi:MAG: hypothetical protein JXB32_11285 [Deltaproteobacteria bacterium]|nr:hypothetical protein [Deltaproteobacteria bacterium]
MQRTVLVMVLGVLSHAVVGAAQTAQDVVRPSQVANPQPTPAGPPGAPVTPAPLPEEQPPTFVVTFAAAFTAYAWADNTEEELVYVDRWTEPSGGLYVGGYYNVGDFFRIGAYLQYMDARNTFWNERNTWPTELSHDIVTLGASAKLGVRFSRHWWIGGGLDVGLRIHPSDYKTFCGVELYPHFEIDGTWPIGGGLELGGFYTLGPIIVPFWDDFDVDIWRLGIHMLFGVMLAV